MSIRFVYLNDLTKDVIGSTLLRSLKVTIALERNELVIDSDNAVQELLKSRPDINAGHGDSDKDDQAMLLAKRAVSVKKERSSSENRENILKNYI